MGKGRSFLRRHARCLTQVGFAALTNGYLPGWLAGRIYTGRLKTLCLPGLNCYSCPGALGACPIGALQATLASRQFSFSFYVLGLLTMLGALLGRLVCGWLCPFGLVQDLLYKIPFVRKLKKLPGEKLLRALRYLVLAVLVLLLPTLVVDLVGRGEALVLRVSLPVGYAGRRGATGAAFGGAARGRGRAVRLETGAAGGACAAQPADLAAVLPLPLPAGGDLWAVQPRLAVPVPRRCGAVYRLRRLSAGL